MFLGIGATKAQINKHYFFWVGRNYLVDDRYKEAIETLNVLLRVDKDAYEGYFLRGLAKYYLEDLIGAEQDFSKAVELNPVYTQAYHFRGIVRAQIGNYDDATNDFREAIDLRPDLPDSYYSRGVTHLLNKQYSKAIDDFDMILRFTDRSAETFINRGTAYLCLKDTLSAYEDYDRAIRTNRDYTEGYNKRAQLLMRQERYEEALSDFNLAVQKDSTYIMPLFNRAIVQQQLGHVKEALADFDHVLELDPYSSVTYFNRAILYSQMGEPQKALDDYNRVAATSPDNVLVYYNRAGVYWSMRRLTEAMADYTKAIELYPDFANAYINRSMLKNEFGDQQGSRRDRAIAERKISEYRSKLRQDEGTESIYADTSRKFNQLLSFDSKLAGRELAKATKTDDEVISLRPMFRYIITTPKADSLVVLNRYFADRLESFTSTLEGREFAFTNSQTDLSADSLIVLDRSFAEGNDFLTLFKRGITQSQVRQYTSAVGIFGQAIELNPTNPFLYINRATTEAEMIDFISQIDNNYNRISIDADQKMRSTKRTYNYDNAIGDLNKAIKLYPELPYTYYNRGNLMAISGELPSAYDDYTRAIELNPDFADAYFNRGLVQIMMKDTRKGCIDLSKAGELGIGEAYTLLKRYAAEQRH